MRQDGTDMKTPLKSRGMQRWAGGYFHLEVRMWNGIDFTAKAKLIDQLCT